MADTKTQIAQNGNSILAQAIRLCNYSQSQFFVLHKNTILLHTETLIQFVVDINHSNIILSTKVAKLYDTDEYITANVRDNGYKSVLNNLLLILRSHFSQQNVCLSNKLLTLYFI